MDGLVLFFNSIKVVEIWIIKWEVKKSQQKKFSTRSGHTNNNSEQSRELIFLHFALKHKNSKELIE